MIKILKTALKDDCGGLDVLREETMTDSKKYRRNQSRGKSRKGVGQKRSGRRLLVKTKERVE